MKIEPKETEELDVFDVFKGDIKENSNQIYLELKDPVVFNVFIGDVKEEIKKTCQGIKNLLGVKINSNGQKMIGITITSSAGWSNEGFIEKVKSKIEEAIKRKI